MLFQYHLCVALAATTLAANVLPSRGSDDITSWAQPRGNASHGGRLATVSGPGGAGALLWRVATGYDGSFYTSTSNGVVISPLIKDGAGTVAFAAIVLSNGSANFMRTDNGARTQLNPIAQASGGVSFDSLSSGGTAVFQTLLYYSTGVLNVTAMQMSSAGPVATLPLWAVSIASRSSASPPIVFTAPASASAPAARLLALRHADSIAVLDSSSGAMVHNSPVPGCVVENSGLVALPTVSHDGQMLFVACYNGIMFSSTALGLRVDDNYSVAWSVNISGTPRWSTYVQSRAGSTGRNLLLIGSCYIESMVYCLLTALDANNGTPVWVAQSSDPFNAPAITGGGLVVTSQPDFAARDAQTGKVVWSYQYKVGSPPTATAVADAQDAIYTIWNNGTACAYAGATGSLVGTLTTGLDGDLTSLALGTDRRLYAAGDHSVLAIGPAGRKSDETEVLFM